MQAALRFKKKTVNPRFIRHVNQIYSTRKPQLRHKETIVIRERNHRYLPRNPELSENETKDVEYGSGRFSLLTAVSSYLSSLNS